MSKAKKCIIFGYNQSNGLHYLVNSKSTSIPDIWWNASSKQSELRKEIKPRIFESIVEATSVLRWLRTETPDNWRLEYV